MVTRIRPKTLRKVLTAVPQDVGRPKVSIAGSGAKAMSGATVAMKKMTGGGSVLALLGEEGENARLATLQKLEATDHTHAGGGGSPTVPLLIEKEAIMEVAAGASPRQVEKKYDLHQDYVAHALKRRFGSPEAAKQALRGFVLENALACMAVAAVEIPNMTGPQAVMSGAILIDKSLALEKAIAEAPKTIDFGALADMGKTLKVLREISSAGLKES